MDLFLIRHGQSFNNSLEASDETEKRVADPELTEKGRKQAQAVAACFADGGHLDGPERTGGGSRLDFLYCSAMIRALQTAVPIGESLGLSPEIWIDVHEVGGLWLEQEDGSIRHVSGLGRGEMGERFPRCVPSDGVRGGGWWRGGLEPQEARDGRAASVAAALKDRAAERCRIGVVSHGGFMSKLVSALAKPTGGDWRWDPDANDGGAYFEHANTAITRIELTPEDRLSIRYLNRTHHISQELYS